MRKFYYLLFCFSFVLFLCVNIPQIYASVQNEISPAQNEALRWVKQEFTDFKTTIEKKMHSSPNAENFETIYQAALKTGLLDPEQLLQKMSYYRAFGRTDSDQLFLRSVHSEIQRATSFYKTGYGKTVKWQKAKIRSLLRFLSKGLLSSFFIICTGFMY